MSENIQSEPTISDTEWLYLIQSSVNKHPALLLKVAEEINWPSKETIDKAIQIVPELSQLSPSASYGLNKDEKQQLQDFWSSCFERTDYSMANIPPGVFMYLVGNNLSSPITKLVEKSTPVQIKDFLSKKTFVEMSSGHDKANCIQALVKANRVEELGLLCKKSPDSINIVDNKGRSPLFAVNTKESFEGLVSLGADCSIKSNGATALDYWIAQKIPNASTFGFSIPSATDEEKIEAMCQKIITNNSSFDSEERELYKKMTTDPGWTFKGNVGGLTREWKASEVILWSECLYAFNVTRPNKSNEYYHYASPWIDSTDKIIHEIRENRKEFADLVDLMINKKTPDTAFEHMVYAIMRITKNSSELSDLKKTPGEYVSLSILSEHKASSYVYNRNQIRLKDQWRTVADSFDAIPSHLIPAFSEELANLACSNIDDKFSTILKQYGTRLASAKSDLYLTDDVIERVFKSRQGANLRSEAIVNGWRSSFVDAFEKSTPQNPTHPELPSKNLNIALSYLSSGVLDSASRTKVDSICVRMIQEGVTFKHVYLRWLNHYSQNLKSLVDKWVIRSSMDKNKTLKKILKEKEDDVVKQAPKRKM